MPDDTGVFTDTANYTQIIPECTNIACGYANEHSGRETLHLPTIFALRDACIKLDWESLPTERNPLVMETKSWSKSSYYAYDLDVSASTSLYGMTRSEMEDMAYTDPETFVALVRQELFDEPVDKRRSYGNDNDYGYAYDWSIRRK
jgi:hypothetical protein